MSASRSRRRPWLTSVLAASAIALGAALLPLPVAQADPSAPEPLPDGAITPVWSETEESSRLFLPVHTPIAPVTSAGGEWTRQSTAEGDQQITLSGEVHFEKHEAILSPTATGILDDVAASWADAPPQGVTIVGHTDTDGETDYNQDLSERRAQAVADYLTSKVSGATFEVSGKGESEPVADETAGSAEEQAAAKDANRRVVITVPR